MNEDEKIDLCISILEFKQKHSKGSSDYMKIYVFLYQNLNTEFL